MNRKEITEKIRSLSYSFGFCACGFSEAHELDRDKNELTDRIQKGFTAEMKYLENNLDKRSDPRLLIKNAKTIISVLLSYFPPDIKISSDYHVSAYAMGNDYHVIVEKLLEQFYEKIKEIIPDVKGRYFCDSAPVFEKAWAVKAGLGWIGKNTILINPDAGSFVFIGEIIIDRELEYDEPLEERCKNCNLCINSCPTSAIVKPYAINAKKCITYHTVENRKEEIPEELSVKFGNRIYACDTCQDVCPHNKSANKSLNKFFNPNEYVFWNNDKWEQINEKKFERVFSNTSIKRLGVKGIKRNIELIKDIPKRF